MNRVLHFLLMLFITYTINGNVTLAWEDINPPPAISYEVAFIRQNAVGQPTGETYTYATTSKTISVKPPKSGTYEVQVKCVNGSQKSSACSSLDPSCAQLKDGTQGSWKVYWKPSGPGGPMVIY
jgi:hypothetical protein